MHKILIASAATLLLSVWMAGPAGAQNREHQQQTAELRILQEQTQQLALTLAQISEALKAINARMDTADQAAQKRFADQELLIKALGADLISIRERTQDTDTRLRSLADEIDALRSTVTSLPSLLSQPALQAPVDSTAVDPNAPVVPGPTPPPTTGAPAPSTVGLSPSRMLELARSDYFNGSYTPAISGFEALLKTFPKSEAAAEAQYLLGETYSAQKRWQDAANAYTGTIQNYPKSNWTPDAYYKRGKAQESLGQPDAARASYEQLMKIYPSDNPMVGLAKQALDRMGRLQATPRP